MDPVLDEATCDSAPLFPSFPSPLTTLAPTALTSSGSGVCIGVELVVGKLSKRESPATLHLKAVQIVRLTEQRIPARIKPYQNSARQQRHFKTKRDQSLKALEKAAYIGRSHFAILFVNARGQVECYSTNLLAPKLDDWFNRDVIAQAEELVRSQPDCDHFGVERPAHDDLEDHPLPSPSALNTPLKIRHAALPPNLPAEAVPFCSQDGVSDAYYLNLFHERMTGDIVKKIGKCWADIVLSSRPIFKRFVGGHDMKPGWWPRDIAYKDPSSLGKPDGAALLLAMIRSCRVPMEQLASLTFASSDVQAAESHSLSVLRELFVVAREDEILRAKAYTRRDQSEVKPSAPSGGPSLHDQYPASSVLFGSSNSQTAEEAEMWKSLIDDTQMGSLTPPTDFPPYPTFTQALEIGAIQNPDPGSTSPPPKLSISFDSPFALRKKETGNRTNLVTKSPRAAPEAAVVNEILQPVVSVNTHPTLVFPTAEWPMPTLPAYDISVIHTLSASQSIQRSPTSPKRGAPSKHQPAGRPKPKELRLDNLPRFSASRPQVSPTIIRTPRTIMTPGCGDAQNLTPYSQTPSNVYTGQVSDGYFDDTPGSSWSISPERLMFSSPRYPATFAFSDELCAPATDSDGRNMSGYFPQLPNSLPTQGLLAPTRSSSMISQFSSSSATMSSGSSFCTGDGDPTSSYMLQPPAEIIERQPELCSHTDNKRTPAAAPRDDAELEGRSWIMI
ncbi:hypothetical protein FRB96_002902 [Tulasnella sp. 330]|nr:hypothetical protein FRB96_002902 [Tulasnella sp. 330]KAG8884359.1 hypothetical protein FRB98_002438 [Tulasnella sp. 332]KAG8884940.1 hypothetical protein FRB97_002768 [Tulasnella sp. 331]